MRTLIFLTILIFSTLTAAVVWSCNTTTYAGCSPEELRAIQQQQFYGRKYHPASPESTDPDSYWRDRQYMDRVRAEERSHELELEKIRSETEVEVAKQNRRSRYYFTYSGPSSYYRPPYRPPYHPPVVRPVPPTTVRPKPVPPIAVRPRPELKGNIYSLSSIKEKSKGEH